MEVLQALMSTRTFAFLYVVIGIILQVFFIFPMILKVDRSWRDREHMKERFKELM